MQEKMKQGILNILTINNGSTRAKLEINLISLLGPRFSFSEMTIALKDLTDSCELIELQFSNPGFNTPISQYYLRGTQFLKLPTDEFLVEKSYRDS